jgi:hypothetical protein
MHRIHVGFIALLIIALGACVRPLVRTEPTRVIIVTVTERLAETTLKEEFITLPAFNVARRPPPPRVALPFGREDWSKHAGSSLHYDDAAVVFTIEESPFTGDAMVDVVEVSAPINDFAELRKSATRYHAIEQPPCIAFTAFFIDGVGAKPRKPVLLTTRHGRSSAATVVDPARAILRSRPVLRMPPLAVTPPVEAFVSIDVATGGADFIILAVYAH